MIALVNLAMQSLNPRFNARMQVLHRDSHLEVPRLAILSICVAAWCRVHHRVLDTLESCPHGVGLITPVRTSICEAHQSSHSLKAYTEAG